MFILFNLNYSTIKHKIFIKIYVFVIFYIKSNNIYSVNQKNLICN